MKSFSRWQASHVTQNKAITGDGAAWFCCHRHQHLCCSHSHHYLTFPTQVFQLPYFWPLLIILKINLYHRNQYHHHNLSSGLLGCLTININSTSITNITIIIIIILSATEPHSTWPFEGLVSALPETSFVPNRISQRCCPALP